LENLRVHSEQAEGRESNLKQLLFRITVRQRKASMKPKILVIDDDAAIRQQLFWTLCDEYEVMTANDLQTAIRRAMVYEPAVSILDLHLPPVLDTPEVGLRILEYIKEHYPNSKVYIVSSESSIETRKACLQNGADGFLSKPLDVEQLLAAVRRSTLAHQLEAI